MVRRLLISFIAVAAFSCDSHPDVTFRDDSVPFSVLFTSPADGENGIELESAVSVVFSRALDSSSFDSTTFSIAVNGTSLLATILVSDHVATLSPSVPLEYLADYEVSLTGAVSSMDGSALTSDFSFSFTTRGLPFELVDEIDNPEPEVSARFGSGGVTAVGQNFVVTAPAADNTAGGVFLHDGIGSLITDISNPSPDFGDGFGNTVSAVAGNFVVTCAPPLTGNGSIYLYNGTTGSLINAIPYPGRCFHQTARDAGKCVTAVGGNFVAVDSYDDLGASQAGSVALYDSAGGLILAIPNPDPLLNDFFGSSGVTAVGNNFVVGVDLDDPGGIANAGSVYLYNGMTGAQIVAIPDPVPAQADDAFGSVVTAVGGNFVVVAPERNSASGADAGAVWLYSGTTGALVRYIPNPAEALNDLFGSSGVTAVGGNFVVSADHDDPGLVVDAGSVYLYNGSNGNLILAIPNPSPAANDEFGSTVTAVGGNFVVTAPFDDPGGVVDAGSVYLFSGTTGALLATLPNPKPTADDQFGAPGVTSIGGYFVVGDAKDDPGGVGDVGSVYVYGAQTGEFILNIVNPFPEANDLFGSRGIVSLGESFVVTTPMDDPGGVSNAGSVYLYAPSSTP